MKYNHLIVPDDPKENAEWRAETLRRAESKHPNAAKFRQQILELCRKDFWYWAKGFAYVHEPRMLDDAAEELNTKVAFLPWPHQIPVVDRILACLGKRDVRVVKSRAQGASWILVLVFIWCWLFKKGFKGNLVSKDEIAVDRRGDTDSIFGKIDILIGWLPSWMVGVKNKHWRRNYSDHYLTRMDGETAITGFACTGDVASGGRATVFGMDEHAKHPQPADRQALAATQPITRCRLFISTPKGKTGAYYDIVHDDTIEEPVLYLSWRDNPTQNRGLYRVVNGRPVAVDVEKYGPLQPQYKGQERWGRLKERLLERGYDLSSGKTRSPWYDEECLRPGAYPVLVDQEYDMVFGSEGAQYFSEALINRLKAGVRRPVRGELDVNTERLIGRWTETPDGRFKVWCDLDNSRNPPMGEYIVGCDICAGVGGEGSSNSALTVFNRRTGAKVASFASPAIIPYEFAELAIAVCRWFVDYKGDPAFLIWEANGHGQEFQIRVERSDFMHYYRRKPADSSLFARDTTKAGYWTQKKSKLLGPYREALLEGFFDDPEYESVEELREYQFGQDGEPFHVGENNKEDPAGAKGAHGDRCFVAGTMIQTDCGERPIEQLVLGDLVWTRNGLRPVIACGKTGMEEVFDVNLPNGRTLTGTANHPVWTENRAWVPLVSLTSSDTLLVWTDQHTRTEEDTWQPTEDEYTNAIQKQRRSCSTDVSTTVLQTRNEKAIEGTFGAGGSAETDRRSHCMLRFGSFITVLFQMVLSYITRILTRTTTTSPTLNVLPTQSMESSTELSASIKAANRRESTTTPAINAERSTSRGSRQGLDFAAQGVLRSIYARAKSAFEEERNSIPVSNAGRSTNLGGRQKLVFAAMSAGTGTRITPTFFLPAKGNLLNHESMPARNAVRSTGHGGLSGQGFVASNAARGIIRVHTVPKRRSVYNLSVADVPEYFAEGVLVHNCVANALAYHASLTFGDQQAARGSSRSLNVNNVRENLVPSGSAAWRRARYLESMRKEKTSRW